MLLKKYGNLAAIAALVLVPLILNDPFLTHMGIRATTAAIVVMGLTLFIGYTGQISLGHAAFFGLAAYISGILMKSGFPFLGSVAIAPISRSEEHTSELQSLMRISYAVFCLKKK